MSVNDDATIIDVFSLEYLYGFQVDFGYGGLVKREFLIDRNGYIIIDKEKIKEFKKKWNI